MSFIYIGKGEKKRKLVVYCHLFYCLLPIIIDTFCKSALVHAVCLLLVVDWCVRRFKFFPLFFVHENMVSEDVYILGRKINIEYNTSQKCAIFSKCQKTVIVSLLVCKQ